MGWRRRESIFPDAFLCRDRYMRTTADTSPRRRRAPGISLNTCWARWLVLRRNRSKTEIVGGWADDQRERGGAAAEPLSRRAHISASPSVGEGHLNSMPAARRDRAARATPSSEYGYHRGRRPCAAHSCALG